MPKNTNSDTINRIDICSNMFSYMWRHNNDAVNYYACSIIENITHKKYVFIMWETSRNISFMIYDYDINYLTSNFKCMTSTAILENKLKHFINNVIEQQTINVYDPTACKITKSEVFGILVDIMKLNKYGTENSKKTKKIVHK